MTHPMRNRRRTWPTPPRPSASGAALAAALAGGMVVTLHGDLGAGKTTLVRGVLRALGWTGAGQEPDLHAG